MIALGADSVRLFGNNTAELIMLPTKKLLLLAAANRPQDEDRDQDVQRYACFLAYDVTAWFSI